MKAPCLLVLSLLACSLAPADALWSGSHWFTRAASPGDVKPSTGLRSSSPVLAFQFNSKAPILRTAPAIDTLETTASAIDKLATVGAGFFYCALVAPVCSSFLSPILFSIAAMQGDVKILRWMVLAGQEINVRALPLAHCMTALGVATLAGKPAAVRFLLEEGAETALGSPFETELEVATRLLAERAEVRSRKGRSWQQKNPPHLDSKLNSFAECVEILKNPAEPARVAAKAAQQLLLTNPSPTGEASSAAREWLCFSW